ncbi:MAG: hypothetical protein QNK36_10550 [Colwellia sp.]|nr:hypothetical protein [Colwellia sp.]
MIDVKQFKEVIITPALSLLQKYSDDAVELLLFTCAAESNGGTYVKQIKGPALGIFQMEPATHQDIWVNYIFTNSSLMNIMSLNFFAAAQMDAERMVYDMRYATVMARLQYSRFDEPLPDRKNIDAMFDYYKKYYNTPSGKAKKAESIKKYKAFVG